MGSRDSSVRDLIGCFEVAFVFLIRKFKDDMTRLTERRYVDFMWDSLDLKTVFLKSRLIHCRDN